MSAACRKALDFIIKRDATSFLVLCKCVVDHLQCEDRRQIAGQDEDRALGRENAGRDAAMVLRVGFGCNGLLQLEQARQKVLGYDAGRLPGLNELRFTLETFT